MHGSAEIVSQDLRLMQRFFYQIDKAFNEEGSIVINQGNQL